MRPSRSSCVFSNDTAQDVTLSVAAVGPTGWEVTATLTGETKAASTVVEAGATQNVTVAATAPADVAAGPYPIQVTATAGERQVTADLAIEVTGSYSMTLSTPNDVLSASGTAGGRRPRRSRSRTRAPPRSPGSTLTATPPTELGGHLRPDHGRDHRPPTTAHHHRDDHALGRGRGR